MPPTTASPIMRALECDRDKSPNRYSSRSSSSDPSSNQTMNKSTTNAPIHAPDVLGSFSGKMELQNEMTIHSTTQPTASARRGQIV